MLILQAEKCWISVPWVQHELRRRVRGSLSVNSHSWNNPLDWSSISLVSTSDRAGLAKVKKWGKRKYFLCLFFFFHLLCVIKVILLRLQRGFLKLSDNSCLFNIIKLECTHSSYWGTHTHTIHTSQTNSEHGKGKWSHIPTSELRAIVMNDCWSGGSWFPIAMKNWQRLVDSMALNKGGTWNLVEGNIMWDRRELIRE